VLRAFVDTDVPGSSDPVEQLGTLEVELVYADLESLEKQADKRRKAARVDKSLADEVAALDAAIEILQTGTPLYRADLDAEALAPHLLNGLGNESVAFVGVNQDFDFRETGATGETGLGEKFFGLFNALAPGFVITPFINVRVDARSIGVAVTEDARRHRPVRRNSAAIAEYRNELLLIHGN
jgi:hypothetical protein